VVNCAGTSVLRRARAVRGRRGTASAAAAVVLGGADAVRRSSGGVAREEGPKVMWTSSPSSPGGDSSAKSNSRGDGRGDGACTGVNSIAGSRALSRPGAVGGASAMVDIGCVVCVLAGLKCQDKSGGGGRSRTYCLVVCAIREQYRVLAVCKLHCDTLSLIQVVRDLWDDGRRCRGA
jgi:hypothetical protein